MTPAEINAAIAEICGWTRRERFDGEWRWYSPDGRENYAAPPDYFHDLNAIHEAEKTLANQFNTLEETYWLNLQHVQPHPIYATAPQRCEAFLMAHGKLRDA